MKTLSVLLLLALGLGVAWWKLTYPDGTLDDARRAADALGARLEAEVATLSERLPPDVRDALPAAFRRDGTSAANTGPFRLATDDDLGADDGALDAGSGDGVTPTDTAGRLGDVERRLDAAAEREATTLARLDTIDQRLGTLLRRLDERGDALAPDGGAGLASAGAADARGGDEPSAAGRSVEYKIYFEPNSTALSAAAARVLDSLVTQERSRTTGVSIYGFADRQGPPDVNREVARERAANARAYLIANGLPADRVRASDGLEQAAAETILPGNADDAQQRVVVLHAAQP